MQKKKTLFPDLSASEAIIMDILWKNEKPMTSPEIREATKEFGIDTYVFKLIRNLKEKGMIKEVGQIFSFRTPTRILAPCCSRQEYDLRHLDYLQEGSVSKFLSRLVESKADEMEVVDEIREWLAEYEKESEDE